MPPEGVRREEAKGRPTVTFLLLGYNQEQFVREAVAGAFAQNYSPLEIILSDDCSSDRTFETMCEMADSYRGPHRIVRNRNPRNLGIAGHINRAMEIASGELVVVAAGDDVSLAWRTDRIFEEWKRTGGGDCSIYSDATLIDPKGRELGALFHGMGPSHARTAEEAVTRGGTGVAGCTHSFTRKCFDVFGWMDSRVSAEDMVIPFRNLLIGNVRYLNERLVQYRTHRDNISGFGRSRPTLPMRRREVENHEAVMASWLNDIQTALDLGFITPERAGGMKKNIFLRQYWLDVEKRYFESGFTSGLALLLVSGFEASDLLKPLKILERRLRTKC